jgi:hypothetical protein
VKKINIIQFIKPETLEILNKKSNAREKLRDRPLQQLISNESLNILKQPFTFDGLIYTYQQFDFDTLPSYKKKRTSRNKTLNEVESLFGWSVKKIDKKLYKKLKKPSFDERMETLDLIKSETRKRSNSTKDKLNIFYESTQGLGRSCRLITDEPGPQFLNELEKKETYEELTLRLIFEEESDTDISDWDVETFMFRGDMFNYPSDDDLENSEF